MEMNGKSIRALRLKMELSQYNLAKRLGVGKNTVGRWERDEFAPTPVCQRLLRELAEEAASK